MSVKREIDFYSELMEQGQGNKLAKAFPKVCNSNQNGLLPRQKESFSFK